MLQSYGDFILDNFRSQQTWMGKFGYGYPVPNFEELSGGRDCAEMFTGGMKSWTPRDFNMLMIELIKELVTESKGLPEVK